VVTHTYLNNVPVSISIPRELLKKIDDKRGDVNRSIWIVKKLEICISMEEKGIKLQK
jgi:metal-responsive CopG/Arc/MetJ family transcriptional regulator